MLPSILIALGTVATMFALPVPVSYTGLINRRLDLVGGTMVTYTVDPVSGDTWSLQRRAAENGGVKYESGTPVNGFDQSKLGSNVDFDSGFGVASASQVGTGGKITNVKDSWPDSLDARKLVKDGFGRGTYGIDAADVIGGSGHAEEK